MDTTASGSIIYRETSDVEAIADMPYSCALDAAEKGGLLLHEVGEALNITEEGARLLQDTGIARVRHQAPELAALVDGEGNKGRRRASAAVLQAAAKLGDAEACKASSKPSSALTR